VALIVAATNQWQPFGSVSAKTYAFLVLSGAATGASWLCYFRALQVGQASQVAPIDKLSVVFVAIFATLFLGEKLSLVNWLGVGLMLGSAMMFAGTVILSQYVLYEMPPTTATLYILSTMAVVVVMAWAAVGNNISSPVLEAAFPPIFILGITTAISRLAMFSSVSVFGSLRTAIIAVAEIGVALTLAFFVLGDRLTTPQVVGVGLLIFSMLLIRSTDLLPRGFNPNALLVHDMANVQFQRIAFHRAFGKAEHDNEYRVMSTLTTAVLVAIQKMLGATNKPVDPFPMNTPNGGSVDLSVFLSSQEDTRPRNPMQGRQDDPRKKQQRDKNDAEVL